MSFNASTTPEDGDSERLLLLRIARILNDAKSGDAPLGVDTAGGGGGTVRTPTPETITADGTVAAGKKYIEFVFSLDFAGTIGGAAWSGATDNLYSLPLLPGADTYAALAYTISAGSARLTTIA